MHKTKWQKIRRLLFFFLLFTIAITWLADARIKNSSQTFLYNQIEEVPFHKVALLLGTNKYIKNGQPNLYYSYRIQAATDLYRAGKIRFIVVSGDNSKKNYNEPQQMMDDLVANGIPASAIFMDFAGFRTLDSIVRMQKIFGQSEFVIISQLFHNERALYLAQSQGLNCVAFNAKDVSQRYGIKVQIREKFARVKVFVDLLTKKKPKFLGEKIEIPT